jgi:hypothetical protein
MDFLLILPSDRNLPKTKLLNLAYTTALRDYSTALDLQSFTVFQLQFENLFDLCSLAQVFKIKTNRCRYLRIGFDDARHGFNFKRRIRGRLPFILNIIDICIFQRNGLFFLEFFIIFSYDKPYLVFTYINSRRNACSYHHHLEEMIIV